MARPLDISTSVAPLRRRDSNDALEGATEGGFGFVADIAADGRDDQFARLSREAEEALKPFAAADGAITFDMSALIIAAAKTQPERP